LGKDQTCKISVDEMNGIMRRGPEQRPQCSSDTYDREDKKGELYRRTLRSQHRFKKVLIRLMGRLCEPFTC
jgi:hypothetical protein